MQRALNRERREYLFRKHKEEQDEKQKTKKAGVKRALDKNVPLEGSLRQDALKLQNSLTYDDENSSKTKVTDRSQDDEYKWAGSRDPKIAVTTSRAPSVRLKNFASEMKLLLPNSLRMNRGRNDMAQLVHICRQNNMTDLVILHETRGKPDGMIVSHFPYGPTAYFTLYNCTLRHDIPDVGHMSLAYPHLITHGFNSDSKIGNRISDILRFLFPVPKKDSQRIITMKNTDDYISLRHHTYNLEGEGMHRNKKEVVLKEVGPRFELRPYKIILNTIESEDTAEVEWQLHQYTNTAKKKRYL